MPHPRLWGLVAPHLLPVPQELDERVLGDLLRARVVVKHEVDRPDNRGVLSRDLVLPLLARSLDTLPARRGVTPRPG
ncbi:MAG: hypothetical protein K0R13_1036 [Propionibacteriaceae bacterium]|nr:hypothetical protein [Propionibacteriaceae bacterium]